MDKNSSKSLKKTLQDLERNQSTRQTEDTALLREESPLRASLTTALEKLAEGDQSQDHIINELKKKLEPIERRREGLASLSERGRNAISRTIELLKDAEAREARELNERLDALYAENQTVLLQTIQTDIRRACDYWLRFNECLGEIMINAHRTNRKAEVPENLMAYITQYPETQGYKKCSLPGYIGQGWSPWAIVPKEANGIPLEEAQRRDNEDRVKWAKKLTQE